MTRTPVDLTQEFLKPIDFHGWTADDFEDIYWQTHDWVTRSPSAEKSYGSVDRRRKSWITAEKVRGFPTDLLTDLFDGPQVEKKVAGRQFMAYEAADKRGDVLMTAAAAKLAEREGLLPLFDNTILTDRVTLKNAADVEREAEAVAVAGLKPSYGLPYTLDGLALKNFGGPAEVLRKVVELRIEHAELFRQLFDVDGQLRTPVDSLTAEEIKEMRARRASIVRAIRRQAGVLSVVKRRYLVLFGVAPYAAVSSAIQLGDSANTILDVGMGPTAPMASLAVLTAAGEGALRAYRWYLGKTIGAVLADRSPTTMADVL